MTIDPRLNAYRPDLADQRLRGKVEATRFVAGVPYVVAHAEAPLRHAPRHDAMLDTEALYGERVDVFEIDEEGWAWGQIASGGYVGYLPAATLVRAGSPATHRITSLRTHGYPAPDFKIPPFVSMPMGAQVAVTRVDGSYAVTAAGLFIPGRHIAPLAEKETDFVAVAERFLGTPYLWGGKTNAGIDCSGLVQVALMAIGVPCLRDCDLQEKTVGRDADIDIDKLRRGDLVFWKGHVAIARDAGMLLHANAYHMAVVHEPVAAAIERIRVAGDAVTSIRRL